MALTLFQIGTFWAALLGMGLLGCDDQEVRGVGPGVEHLVEKLESEIRRVDCPVQGDLERETLAKEQAARAGLEVLRQGVDIRSVFRASRSAAVAHACTAKTSSEWGTRNELAADTKREFLERVRRSLYQRVLARRAKNLPDELAALRLAVSLIAEAAPELAVGLRAQARGLEPQRK